MLPLPYFYCIINLIHLPSQIGDLFSLFVCFLFKWQPDCQNKVLELFVSANQTVYTKTCTVLCQNIMFS